jgi:hypothetical protein
MQSRKVCRIPITPASLFYLLRPDPRIKITVTGIPEDAAPINAAYDWHSDTIMLFVQSDTFEFVEVGAEVPTLPVVMHAERID